MGGYGGRFSSWLHGTINEPYNSFGNGAAMRVSPCAIYAVELEEALMLAKASAEVTHNHPEGIKGAQATAAAIFLAKTGKSRDEIREHIENNYYRLDFTLDDIRTNYGFDETCQGTVPQAIAAFLESENFEDAIRNAISIGGDSDTLAAITGAIAWAFYRDRGFANCFFGPKVIKSACRLTWKTSEEKPKNDCQRILQNLWSILQAFVFLIRPGIIGSLIRLDFS